MNARQDAMPTTRGLNFYVADGNLELICSMAMDAETFARARPHLVELGALAGDELDRLATLADKNPPVLRAYDERGTRVDEVVFHPAYRAMEALAFGRFGLAAMSHRPGVLGWPTPVPHVVKYALSYLFSQAEFGLLCPVSVTDSTSRMLRWFGSEELKARYLPRLTSTDMAEMWQGTQWMTEKTGGSDVGASTTVARQDADGTWRLWGDKWFCSNANTDVALTLARPEGAPAGTRGLAMFLVPRILPDGSRNAWTLNRLKDKLGSRSMASAEVTYAGAIGYVVGDPTRGFRQMMEMVNVSRLSNAMRAAGLMRRALFESVVHTRGRAAFGSAMVELPQLRRDLLEMLLDAEAAASVVIHAAAVLDRADAGREEERALVRVLTPLAKYWITARARAVTAEAMNVRGGNGYVEEWVNARLLRDSFLGAIWEGASNVVALDVQRALVKNQAFAPLARFVAARLATVTEPTAKPWKEAVTDVMHGLEHRVAAWPTLDRADRELDARPTADLLYHALAASLLLAEGQRLVDRDESFRKVLVAALYVRKWLRPPAPPATALPWAAIQRLDALVDWERVPREALGAVEPVRG